MEFDGTQIEIGVGAQAVVYRYRGFAYKVYKPTYPAEWIAFEKMQQKAVNEAGLCPVRYYDTDDEHVIKMDLIEGVTLEQKMREWNGQEKGQEENESVKGLQGFEILADAFRKVHGVNADNVNMPMLIDTALMGLDEKECNVVAPIIERLSGKMKNGICHLDLHFLNIMLPDNYEKLKNTKNSMQYTIIDWMNARIAPAVFDYARTFVILEEFAKDILAFYEKVIAADLDALKISKEDFLDAVCVCRILRQQEKKT